MRRQPPRRAQGFTLVEVLIAATLGLLILAAIVGVFVANSRNYRQNDAIAALQDNARFALEVLGRDLAMAGYAGGIQPLEALFNVRNSATLATAVPIANQCGPTLAGAGWLFDLSTQISFHDHLDGPTAAAFPCLTGASAERAMTDVIAIRRVAAQPAAKFTATATAKLAANRIYLVSNGNIGSLIQWPATGAFALGQPANCPDEEGISATCPPADYPVSYYAYTPRIYYVQNNNGNPRLCRRVLPVDAIPAVQTMADECLADGVENIQFEWGLDTDADAANVVDRYLSDPTAAQLALARTVRIHVIVRTPEQNLRLSNDNRSFKLANYEEVAESKPRGFIRRSYTTTVQLKNVPP